MPRQAFIRQACLSLLLASASAAPLQETCSGDSAATCAPDAQLAEVSALLQVQQSVQVRRDPKATPQVAPERAPQAARRFKEGELRLYREAAQRNLGRAQASHDAAARQPAAVASFVSIDGNICIQGPPRAAEDALALKKAAIIGRFYDNVYPTQNLTCVQRGYTLPGGEDHCNPNVQVYCESAEGCQAFGAAEAEEFASIGARIGVTPEMVHTMFVCTCRGDSPLIAEQGTACEDLNNQFVGSWVHRNPETQQELLCGEGPFVMATLALAVLKSSAQLPMHLHDAISAESCASRGFPKRYDDHCFLGMHMCTREDADFDAGIWGAGGAVEVEDTLFNGGFQAFFQSRGIDVNLDVLTSLPGCHCLPGSEVFDKVNGILQLASGGLVSCDIPDLHPPVRDWWVPTPASLPAR